MTNYINSVMVEQKEWVCMGFSLDSVFEVRLNLDGSADIVYIQVVDGYHEMERLKEERDIANTTF